MDAVRLVKLWLILRSDSYIYNHNNTKFLGYMLICYESVFFFFFFTFLNYTLCLIAVFNVNLYDCSSNHEIANFS